MSINLVSPIRSKETVIDGKTQKIESLDILGKELIITRGFLTFLKLEDEWFDDIDDPTLVINAIKVHANLNPDIFCFWQRLPDTTPKFNYYFEWDNVAALKIKGYDYWWNNQIKSNTRGHIRKAQKKGVIVKEAEFDDAFIRGMVEIFNETPIRQDKPFWHYGKDFETVKREFSRYLFRETLIGAYFEDKLIGFIMLGCSDEYATLGQIISKIEHRDKNSTNALIAKAVEICEAKKIPFLVYAHWPSGSLADFKTQNGFEKIDLPRYYIPMNWKGKLALKYGFHHSWKERVPESIKVPLKQFRKMWNKLRKK